MSFKIPLIRKRTLAFSVLAVLITAGTILAIVACNPKTMSAQEASRWIAAYTPAHIDQDSKIRIELTDLTKSKIDTARSLEKVFSFSPKIKGIAHYSADKRYIDFVPSESIKQAQKYRCRVKIRTITAVDTLADFAFDFYVDKREMRFEDVVATVDPDNVAMMSVKGRLEYNVAAGDSITSDSTMLICDYPGAKIIMDKHCVNHSRGFKIAGIKRHDKDRSLTLSINPMGGFSNVKYEVTVPSVSDFKLLNAERIEASEPYINLEFSTPLSSTQELDGLISIDKISTPRIERSGANVKVFYGSAAIPNIRLHISDLLKNIDGRSLDEEIEKNFTQKVIPPAIEIPFKGNILPDNRNLKLPFRAVNLAAVDVEVVKIFPANVMSFLQENNIYGTSELRRFGRLVYHKTVRLDRDKSLNLHQWQNFSIDLKNLFIQERGAVYNIRLTFRKAYSLYDKENADDFEEVDGITEDDKEIWDRPWSYIYRDAPDYKWGKYNWQEANDPSKDTYYMVEWDRMPEVNLVASNLGLIVKRANNREIKAVVTDLLSANPAAGIPVCAYNYQLQKIGSAVTNENGFAEFRTESNPFMVTASDGRSTTYLKINSGYELSTSNFDVSGTTLVDGIKGFTYGERGVWRPGDDIHLTLIVEDKNRKLPNNHPVVMTLYNPNEQVYERQTLTKGINGFYVFNISTEESVQTGLWRAEFMVGNETFHHPVRIETIKPNRLKISINTPAVINADRKNQLGMTAHWLTGPVAKDMAASMEITLHPNPTPFEDYKKYSFKNPLIAYTSSQKELYSGRLDSLGMIVRDCTIGADVNSPGMLLANITAKVTEPGGDASITSKSVPFSPFGVYVGIDLGEKTFETDKNIKFPVIVLNQVGAKMKSRVLDYKIYRLDWNWWWEGGPNDLSRYVQSTTADVVANGAVTAENGIAEIPFKIEYPNWGKYLILVRDAKGGHATGGVVMVDWPEWRGRSNKGNPSGSTELSFTLDKPQYEVGETANVFLPKCAGGKVLLSIENGSKIIKKMWVSLSATKETKYPIVIDKSMAPNFYVSATMLHPHKATDFDTPIRFFGVQSVKVVNPQSILHPEIVMPDELHPQQPFTVKISERDRKPMTYTLAIVDEGLLDITYFKTPRPWAAMNKKEALGVKTWDMFDDVIGAFGSNFRSIMSIGGDEALRKAAGKEKRFNPVVKFIGPFTTNGSSKTHRITLPNYVGSVRVMVVAAQNGCYGHTDKTVKVTSPLMQLSSIPRTLANCDTITVPVNIFVMDKNLKNVSVNIQAGGPIKVLGKQSCNLGFKEPGEQLTNFCIVCDNNTEGKGRIILTAAGNGHISKDTTYIDVANPMPNIIESVGKTLAAKSSIDFSWTPRRKETVFLQIASLPIPNFKGIALFMESYPHLCTEQLSSKALFMLYGRRFLNSDTQSKCGNELPCAIKYLQSRQIANGGFIYWPGQAEENEWVTSMVGLALAEASRQGFRIDRDVYTKWQAYQEKKSRDYRYSLNTDLTQAFRLYSMAIAGKPQTSAMNRLRESKQLSQAAAYCLASAYAESGRKDVAMKLIERAGRTELSKSSDFWSAIRNYAIELDALALSNQSTGAIPLARKITDYCNGTTYVTQDIAFSTIAINHLADIVGTQPLSVIVAEKGQTPKSITDNGCLKELQLNTQSGNVEVTSHNDKGNLELSLMTSYQPEADATIVSSAKGLKMTISYVDLKGQPITINGLKQDTEFKAKITVANLINDVENMALTYAIPSGWEIWNNRFYGSESNSYDNCDIRDSSVNFYFGIKKGESRTFEVRLRAAYLGHYLLPPTVCEDMYNPNCRAIISNRRISVMQ